MKTLVKQRIALGLLIVVALCAGCSSGPVASGAHDGSDVQKQLLEIQKVQGKQAVQIEELNTKILLLKDEMTHKTGVPSQKGASDLRARYPTNPKTPPQITSIKPDDSPNSVNSGTPVEEVPPPPPEVAQNETSTSKAMVTGPSVAAVASGSAEKIFDRALADAKVSQTAAIEKDVEVLLKNYRESPVTNNAIFLLGETLYQKNQYSKAAEQYERLYKMFPDGNKAVASLYHLGLCYDKMGHHNEAQEAYQNVVSVYPGSREAIEAAKRIRGTAADVE